MIDDFHISSEEPPCWDLLEPGKEWHSGIFVTYGDTIYTKSEVTEAVLAHECVHLRQQHEFAGSPDAYVQRYVSDPEFQYNQELEAYRAEYRFQVEKKGIVLAEDEAERMADDLADPTKYQIPAGITRDQVLRDILDE